jgi:nitronate monooxygenase
MEAKAWRDIWGCGQGIGAIREVSTVEGLVTRFEGELDCAKKALEERLRTAQFTNALRDLQ